MAFTETFATFFSTSDFGVAALWKGATSVNGIFDAAYADPLGVAEGSKPAFTCEAAAVTGVKHGDTMIINATTYKVRGVQPDGTGVVVIVLEEQ